MRENTNISPKSKLKIYLQTKTVEWLFLSAIRLWLTLIFDSSMINYHLCAINDLLSVCHPLCPGNSFEGFNTTHVKTDKFDGDLFCAPPPEKKRIPRWFIIELHLIWKNMEYFIFSHVFIFMMPKGCQQYVRTRSIPSTLRNSQWNMFCLDSDGFFVFCKTKTKRF